jgi:hypothetical protein
MGFGPASRFVALVFSTHHTTFRFPSGRRTAFREPLQFIVMSVMGVIADVSPYTYGVSP